MAGRAGGALLVTLALASAALTWPSPSANRTHEGGPQAPPGIARSTPAAVAQDLTSGERPASEDNPMPGAVIRPEARIDLPSAAVRSQSPPEADDAVARLPVPYRSQFDGSTFEWGNCGVSAISMAMEYYGHAFTTHDVRVSINQLTGNWDTHIGVDWRYLKIALEQRGFATEGPYAAPAGYIAWTLDDVLAHVGQGRPVMLLLHYRSLPGHEEDEWVGDHYLLILGQTRDGQIVYHDPGFEGDRGAFMTIDRARLEHAWANTWIGQNRAAMVILPAE
jgi:hypothetical protein